MNNELNNEMKDKKNEEWGIILKGMEWIGLEHATNLSILSVLFRLLEKLYETSKKGNVILIFSGLEAERIHGGLSWRCEHRVVAFSNVTPAERRNFLTSKHHSLSEETLSTLVNSTHGWTLNDLSSLLSILSNNGNDITSALQIIQPTLLRDAFETFHARQLLAKSTSPVVMFGGDHVKRVLLECVSSLSDSNVGKDWGIKPRRGLLLVGPSGCGKTHAIQWLIAAAPINVLVVRSSDVLQAVVGASERRLSHIFTVARECAPCILVMDPIDSIGRIRGFDSSTEKTADRLLSTLLVELDGAASKSSTAPPILLLGVTSAPHHLDPALTRAGRLDLTISIPPPSLSDRTQYLEFYLKDLCMPTVHFTEIAGMMESYTYAMLDEAVQSIKWAAVRNPAFTCFTHDQIITILFSS